MPGKAASLNIAKKPSDKFLDHLWEAIENASQKLKSKKLAVSIASTGCKSVAAIHSKAVATRYRSN
tara:strand:- start:87 stop:284 length:198 start_codon:yes stop_codon:yes gene_type:complete